MALLYLFLQLRHVTGSPRRINTVPECSVAVSPLWGELASLPSSKPFCWKHSKKMKYAHYTPKKNKSPIIPVSKYNWCSSFGDYFLYRSFFFSFFFLPILLLYVTQFGALICCVSCYCAHIHPHVPLRSKHAFERLCAIAPCCCQHLSLPAVLEPLAPGELVIELHGVSVVSGRLLAGTLSSLYVQCGYTVGEEESLLCEDPHPLLLISPDLLMHNPLTQFPWTV